MRRFTIVTVVYNDIKNLERTCNSVAKQSFKDYEHLIIDGGSTDGTVDYLRKLSEYSDKIRYISERDNGIYDAMNKAAPISNGEYICFLNAADKFATKDTLKEINELLSDKVDVLYGKCVFSSGFQKYHTIGRKLHFLNILFDGYVAHQSVFAKKELLIMYPFDLQYKYQADQDFMFRVRKDRYRLKYVDKVVSLYDGNGVSSDPQLFSVYQNERYSMLKKYCPIAYYIRQIGHFALKRGFRQL